MIITIIKCSKRMILNLKFYKFVNYKHFNMLSINNAFNIIGRYKYIAVIDLTDAFFFYTDTSYS